MAGHKDVLGLWAGNGAGESAKFWLQVLSELKNRGVEDVFFVVCYGLKGLPDSVGAVFRSPMMGAGGFTIMAKRRRHTPEQVRVCPRFG